jgi:anti-sigma B factor antagonist
MNLSVRTQGRVSIVDVSGRLVLSETGGGLRAEVRSLLDTGRTHILINLGGVTAMDSSGLGELLAAKKASLVAGAKLRVLRPKGPVYNVLAEAGIDRVFRCFDDERNAVRSFESEGHAHRE